MKIDTIIDLYALISESTENLSSRKRSILLRGQGLSFLPANFIKCAFDTRRINQETEFNPRRGLQNYNRSEAFLTQATADKLVILSKLQGILEELKNTYEKSPEWQDSKTRILLNTINIGLRSNAQDGDYTEVQPGVGSLDYIEELLDMRYRLSLDNINKLADSKIRAIILGKDEDLGRDYNRIEITNHDVATKTYDTLMEKLFGGIKATKDNPEVERTVTITIKDKFSDIK